MVEEKLKEERGGWFIGFGKNKRGDESGQMTEKKNMEFGHYPVALGGNMDFTAV